MYDSPRARLIAYGVAVLATGLSVLLRLSLLGVVGTHGPFITFFPVVILSAYIGGLRAGLVATLLSAAAVDYFLIEPRYTFRINDEAAAYTLVLFVLTGVAISALGESRLSARRRAAANERRYAVTLASIGDAVIATDTWARVTFLNPAAEALTGWPLADAIGRPLNEVFRIINEQTRQPAEDPAAKVLRLGTLVGLANHTALLTRDGREVPIDDCGAPIVDDRGVIAGVVLVFRDVTQRRQAEEREAFRRANERVELAVRGSNVGVWDIDMPDGDYQRGRRHYMNIWEQFGFERPPDGWGDGSANPSPDNPVRFAWTAATASSPPWETAAVQMHPEDRGRIQETVRRYLAGETREYETEVRFCCLDGSYRTMLARGVAVRDVTGKPIRFIGSLLDITKLKLTEEALRESEQRWRSLTEALPQLVWSAMPDGGCDYFSTQWTEHTGVAEGELLGWRWLETLHPEDREPTRQFWLESVAGHRRYDVEYRVRHRDGEYRWFKTRGVPIRDGSGNIVKWFGTCTDITDLRRTEEALRASEQRFRVFADHAADAFFLQDEQGRVLDVNRRACESLGYARDELIGMTPADFDPDFNPDLIDGRVRRLVAGETVAFESRHRRKDGTVFPVEIRGKAFEEGGRGFFVSLVRDVTERKQAEAALRASEERFRTLAKATNDAVWDWDLATNRVWWNEGVLTLFGYRLEHNEADPRWWLERVHPDDREAVEALFFDMVHGTDLSWVDEYRFRCADGSYKDVYDRGYVLRDPDGRAVRMIGAMLDITERKRAEDALREARDELEKKVAERTAELRRSERHLAEAQKLSHTGSWTWDPSGLRPSYWSEEMFRIWGFDPEQGPPPVEVVWQRIHPEDRERAQEDIDRARRCEPNCDAPQDHRIVMPDGTVKHLLATRHPLLNEKGELVELIGTTADVTERKRAEEALRRSEVYLAEAQRLSHTGSWAYDVATQRAIYFSEETFRIFGLDPQSGKLPDRDYYLRLMHPEDRDRFAERTAKAFREKADYALDFRFVMPDGTVKHIHERGHPILKETGEVVEYVGTQIDVTEQKRVEEELRASERRYRNIFETAGVSIWEADFSRVKAAIDEVRATGVTDFRRYFVEHPEFVRQAISMVTILDVNPATVRLCAAASKDELLVSLDRVFVRISHEAFAGVLLAIAEGQQSIESEAALQTLPGEKLTVLYTIAFAPAPARLDRVLVSVMNITERRAREAAEAANRAKDEFLANVSHEIRTPMNAILGMTELTLETELTENQRQCLQTVKSAADNLLDIINDLLDFSKIEAGKLELGPVDFSLRALVGDTLRALAVRAHKKGLELIYDVQPEVPDALVGDAGRLRQILLNLVGNAIKFTDAGEVVVRVETSGDAPADPGAGEIGVRFTVRDTGIGIPLDKQESVFRAFEQEDTSTTRKYGGTGLGLTIASRLVALMGGQITVDSEPGRGSTFAFTARFGLQPHPPEQPAGRPPDPLHGLRVLIVDDNATNRRILEEWLRGWQMEPVAVGDALAALDALWDGVSAGRPYALVLLDARMPDTDGLELAAKIRKRAELCSTRIILLTSGEYPGDWARFRELRGNARLLKPVPQDELLATIYEVMRQGGASAPPASRPPGEGAQPLAPAPAARQLRILVAEDNEFNAQLLEQLLGRRGWRVRLADNGRTALALAREGGFDLLLLDVHMPELDGFQVAQALRERERTAGGHLPIIALTARSRREDREQCLAAGMDDFLSKPVQAADLWEAIDRVIGACPPADRSGPGLLDPRVLLAACDGDALLLEKISQSLRARLPGHMKAVQDALEARDALRLREAAHKLSGMVAAFSTAAGSVASSIEDHAAQGQLQEAGPLVARLDGMTNELMRLVDGLSLESLRQQAQAADAPD